MTDQASLSAAAAAERQRRRIALPRLSVRNVMLLLGVIGLGIAAYTTASHYIGFAVLCTTKHNSCEAVQSSRYAEVVGIPVALLGLIGYLLILGTLIVRASEATRLATLGLTVFGFGFSAYLTYRELFTLHEICEWCVSSAIVMTLLFGLAVWRYLSGAPAGPSQPPVGPR
jgi:uncharacterized membrane protein